MKTILKAVMLPDWSENSTGMYFLPFFGLGFSSDLEWTPQQQHPHND